MTAIVDKAKCQTQGLCLAACPVDAITIENGKAVVDSELCIDCEACVAACPEQAIYMAEC